MLVSGAFTMRIEGIGRKNRAPYVGLSRDENIDDKESELRILVDLVNSVDVARNTGELIIVSGETDFRGIEIRKAAHETDTITGKPTR